MPRYRCPGSLLRFQSNVAAFLDSYARYVEHGTLPAEGAWGDQSASWVHAVRIADDERGRIERNRQDEREKERRAAEVKAEAQRRTQAYGSRR